MSSNDAALWLLLLSLAMPLFMLLEYLARSDDSEGDGHGERP